MGARAARRSRSRSGRRLRTRRPGAAHALAAGALLLTAAAVAAPSLAAQSRPDATSADSGAVLRGTVASAVTGRPLHPARVVHLETGSGAMTDSAGSFAIRGLPAGPGHVEVGMIGYGNDRVELRLRAGHVTEVVFLLGPEAVRVEDLRVTVERERDTKLTGFEERRERGIGYFLGPEEIERRKPNVPSDLLRRVPGVEVGAYRGGGARIRLNRGDLGGGLDCPPHLYLDGMYVPGLHIDELTVQDFMAMEIYRGPGETPPRFSRGQRYCGVIVIWTHDGRP